MVKSFIIPNLKQFVTLVTRIFMNSFLSSTKDSFSREAISLYSGKCKKMSECQTKAGNQNSHSLTLSQSLTLSFTHSRHTEQLLFSCLYSKVSICNYVTCHILHVTCNMSHCECHMSHCACHMSYVKCLC